MKLFQFVVGELIFVALISGILINIGSINNYIDYPSLILVMGGSLAMLLMSFSLKDAYQSLLIAFGNDATLEEMKFAAYFWECMIRNIFMVAILGACIGFVQMLNSVSELEQIGQAMALLSVTFMYGFFLMFLLPLPTWFFTQMRIIHEQSQVHPEGES